MVWDEAYQNKDIYEWYRKLIQIRKNYIALTEGRTTTVFCDDAHGVFAITKELNGPQIVLLAHAKDGEVDGAQISQLLDFVGMENVIKQETFSGNLSTFELAVLIKK